MSSVVCHQQLLQFRTSPKTSGWILTKLGRKNPYMTGDSFTILVLWVLGLAVSDINEPDYKLMSPEHYF